MKGMREGFLIITKKNIKDKEKMSPEEVKFGAKNFVVEKKGKIKADYRIGACLGKGAYGEVRKCQHRVTKDERAVKIILKSLMEEDERKKLMNEVEILRQLDHPNILRLYEFYQDKRYFFIVTQLCTGGELFDKISEEQFFSEKDAANIMKQVLQAIRYCHSQNIVHRDLKPENLLIDADSSELKIKVIDFGTASMIDPGKKLTAKFGTPYYIAPQVLKKSYTEKCDLWSCGVILYILLCGYPPFNGTSDKLIIEAVKTGHYTLDEPEWDQISEDAKDLVRKLLNSNYEKRISAEGALSHPWITKMSDPEHVSKSVTIKTLKNLRNFRAEEKLKQATLSYIASQLLSKSEKEHLEKIFKLLDTDGNGCLSKKEILDGWEKHIGSGMTEYEIEEMFDRIDIDKSGEIDYSEFVMATINEKNLLTKEKLQAAFNMFDRDKSGSISYDEVKEILGKGHDEDSVYLKIIAQADGDGNGEISFEEFCKLMTKLAK